jgi:hypothetical protein
MGSSGQGLGSAKIGSEPNDDAVAVTGAAPISFADFAANTASGWK